MRLENHKIYLTALKNVKWFYSVDCLFALTKMSRLTTVWNEQYAQCNRMHTRDRRII